jgi:hypothetical protein
MVDVLAETAEELLARAAAAAPAQSYV